MDTKTQAFYDNFWPRYVPHYEETRKYVLGSITPRRFNRALDAGCGHGLCSVALSEVAQEVLAVDISAACLDTARTQARKLQRTNITFLQEDLQELTCPDESFDLVWCWGVAMMAPDPQRVMRHLFRVTQRNGELYLGLYLKTWASPIHQALRTFCRTCMNSPRKKKWVLDFFAGLTRLLIRVRGKENNTRADNVSIQAQVEDWFYPPYKTFYTVDEIIDLMKDHGFAAECVQRQVGRFKSSTIFVVRGVRK